MSEEKKYFVPTIEEFHIGYEFEAKEDNGKWVKDVITSSTDIKWLVEDWLVKKNIRIKYLDKEDILAEGWEDISDKMGEVIWRKKFKKVFQGANYWLILRDNTMIDLIAIDICKEMDKGILSYDESTSTVFHGMCKSVNELRKLQQWLQINNPGT